MFGKKPNPPVTSSPQRPVKASPMELEVNVIVDTIARAMLTDMRKEPNNTSQPLQYQSPPPEKETRTVYYKKEIGMGRDVLTHEVGPVFSVYVNGKSPIGGDFKFILQERYKTAYAKLKSTPPATA